MSVTMTTDYLGELHCRIKHEPSGAECDTDAPKDNAGRGEAFSPTDLVGAALVTCAITTMAIKAPKEGLPFETASGRVVKHMTSAGPRKIARLELEITMPAGLDANARERLETIARTCPVALSLGASVEVDNRFVYPD
jgi:uncharacterized OsmC-like protein